MCDNEEQHGFMNIFRTLDDYDNLTSLCKQRLLEAIDAHLHAYNNEKIDTLIVNYTQELVMSEISPLINSYVSILSGIPLNRVNSVHLLENYNIINDSIAACIKHTLDTIYANKIRIARQYNEEFKLSKHANVDSHAHAERKKVIYDTITYLQTVPQPEQRTPEWYAFRQDCITASSAWKILDTLKQQENFIKSKIIDTSKSRGEFGTNIESAFHHGHKYEPLSTMLYEHLNKTKIGEFGCIKHKDYDYIGASPDGINIDPTSEKYGTLLEIKNVVSREINGIPKKEYWTQMQMQMEVCNLDYCDFLETKFIQYSSEDEFLEHYSKENTVNNVNNTTKSMTNNDGNYIGLIVMFYVNNNPLYEYCPLHLNTPEKVLAWKDSIVNKYLNDDSNSSWVDNIYWECKKYSCICVERNRDWFKRVLPAFEKMWNTIKQKRIEGAATGDANVINVDDSKKKKRKLKTQADLLNGSMGICLIKLD